MKRPNILFVAIIILLLWQVLSMVIDLPMAPSSIEILTSFINEVIKGDLLIHFFVSLYRVLASTLLAILIAAPLGMILGQSKRLNSLFNPAIYLLYPIPKVVFVPVVLLFFGIGDFPKILIIFIVLFFQILVLVRDYAAGLPPELIYSVRSLGSGKRGLFRYVYFQGSLPAVLTALRQSIGTAVAILYIAELFATQKGLGYFIFMRGSNLFDYPAMFAGIIALSIMGVALYFATEDLERALTPWHNPKS
ncbi:ABC transporter permease [Chloroflexota bacterium]